MRAKLVEDFKYLKPKSKEEIDSHFENITSMLPYFNLVRSNISIDNKFPLIFHIHQHLRKNLIKYKISLDLSVRENGSAVIFKIDGKNLNILLRQNFEDNYVEMIRSYNKRGSSWPIKNVLYSLEDFIHYLPQFSKVDEGFKYLKPKTTEELKKAEEEYDKNWKPDGVMMLSNSGGMEVKIIDSGDGVQYRFSYSDEGFQPIIDADIEYGYDEDDFEIDDEGNPEYKPYFSIGDTKYFLDEFMKIN